MEGQGRKLNEDKPGPSKRVGEQQQHNNHKKPNSLQSMIQEEKRKMLEEIKMKEMEEMRTKASSSSMIKQQEEHKSKYADFESKQLFSCPSIGLVIPVSINELIIQIRQFIVSSFSKDLVLVSALIIRNCNLSLIDEEVRKQVDDCVLLIEKVLTNLTTNDVQDRDKFRRLNKSKLEQKVSHIEGCAQFLTSIGFGIDMSGEWLVFNGDDTLIMGYLDVLKNAQQYPIVLDRQTYILESPASSESRMETNDDDFFTVNAAEVSREQQERTAQRELNETLRTRAMREAHSNLNKLGKCKFTRLKLKLPSGGYLEGTFNASETLCDVKNWIIQQLGSNKEFKLIYGRETLSLTFDYINKTLTQLNLIPSAALILWFVE